MRKKRFLIGGILIFLAIGYLGYTGFQGSATYYYTVSEVIELGTSVYDENVRVNGRVTAGSIEQEAEGRFLRFTIADDEESLPVVYRGVVPDNFKVGNEVVVEGHLNSGGVFQANNILAKCPSKYVPAK